VSAAAQTYSVTVRSPTFCSEMRNSWSGREPTGAFARNRSNGSAHLAETAFCSPWVTCSCRVISPWPMTSKACSSAHRTMRTSVRTEGSGKSKQSPVSR